METFWLSLSSLVVLGRLAQLNSAISATNRLSIELLIHREVRVERDQTVQSRFVGRPV